MDIKKLMLGELQANCYMLINHKNECVLVDPGGESEKIVEIIKLQKLKPIGIFVTHGHFDHIGAVSDIAMKYEIPVYAHKFEGKMMKDPNKNLSSLFSDNHVSCIATEYVLDNDRIEIGEDLVFTVIEVPGHSDHSLCFYHKDGYIFTGDTLFNGSIGRTDLYSGESSDLTANIEQRLFTLEDKTIVYPGHGPITSIGVERINNPFFGGY
jgi:glyoxylase-like metal-dependent hydrolase (beta-lactamase superfamily II)